MKKHPTLTGSDFTTDEPLRPLKAIRAKCLECCGGNAAVVRECDMTDCALWPFRSGKNPRRAGMGRASNLRPQTVNSVGQNEDETGD